MGAVAFAFPLRDGRTDAARIALGSCWSGGRREAFQDACRRAGITREVIWIQKSSGEDRAVMYLEADDPVVALAVLGRSTEPFDRWFRANVGVPDGEAWDPRYLSVELVLDFDIDGT